jgi:hypothetical protein
MLSSPSTRQPHEKLGGWASSLAWVFAIPICLSTVSCLLASAIWLAFFAVFPRPRLTQRWRWALVFAPLMLFGLPIVASAAAMIYAPSALAKTLAARAFSGLGAFYTRYCGRRLLAVFQCAPAVSGWVRSRHWKGTRPPVPLRDLISCGCRVCRPASRTERSRGEQCYRGSRCMRRIYLPAVPLHPTARATGVRVREDKRM